MTALANVLPEIKLDFPEEFETWQDYFNSISFDNDLGDLPETNNPRIKLFLSRFNVYQLYFAIRDLEIKLEKHYFYAPFNGSIVVADLRAGATARNGSKLGEIISLADLEVEIPLPVEDVRWIDYDQKVGFSSLEFEGNWSGNIVRISSDIDQRTQTVKAFVALEGNGHRVELISGVFLEANLPGLDIPDGFTIPRQALYEESYVYLIENGKLIRREVSIARHEKNSVIIDEGLSNGDTLVVELLQGVAPGMPAKSRQAIEVENIS